MLVFLRAETWKDQRTVLTKAVLKARYSTAVVALFRLSQRVNKLASALDDWGFLVPRDALQKIPSRRVSAPRKRKSARSGTRDTSVIGALTRTKSNESLLKECRLFFKTCSRVLWPWWWWWWCWSRPVPRSPVVCTTRRKHDSYSTRTLLFTKASWNSVLNTEVYVLFSTSRFFRPFFCSVKPVLWFYETVCSRLGWSLISVRFEVWKEGRCMI